jgi:putative transcriptional regulator
MFLLHNHRFFKCGNNEITIFARLMGEHKMKIADVARETGLHRNTISLLYKETAVRIELEAMDKLCQLFECEAYDLFEKI